MTLKQKKILKTFLLIFGFYAFSFVTLLFCSQNSFLYAMNDWCDVNWYITMGRGFLAGQIPYRDLFEQKGPIVYMVATVAALFKNPYYGVFLIETVTLCAFLVLCYKFSARFLNCFYSIVAAVVVGVLTITSSAFSKGGGAIEEYALPALMWLVICFYDMIMDRDVGRLKAFFMGALIAVLFWMKFTLIIIPLSLFAVWFVLKLVKLQQKKLLKPILFMALGFISVSAVIIILFAALGALKPLFAHYFYDNIFRYTSSKNPAMLILLLYIFKEFYIVCLFILAIVLMFILNKKNIPLIIGMFISVVLIILSGSFEYYYLALDVYLIFAVILILCAVCKLKIFNLKYSGVAVLAVATALCVGLSFLGSNVRHELGRPKESFIQVQVAEKIKSFNLDNPTLLCYCYDLGFYNTLGVLPPQKYYARNNFLKEEYPELFQAFEDSVTLQKTDFFLLETIDYENSKDLFENHYTLVQRFKNYTFEKGSEVELDFVLLINDDLAYLLEN